jgi:hypothetical protein
MFDGPSLFGPWEPAGTNLPVTPELKLKVNATARCSLSEVPAAIRLAKHLRFLKTKTASLLKGNQVRNLGMQPAYEILDLIGGIDCNKTMVQLVVPNTADKRAQLTEDLMTTRSLGRLKTLRRFRSVRYSPNFPRARRLLLHASTGKRISSSFGRNKS